MAIYTCGNCGDDMELPAESIGQIVACPHCGAEFTAAAEGDPAQTPEAQQEEFDAIRIKRLSMERRAAQRARSYCVIAAVGCAVGAAEFIYFAVGRIRAADGGRVSVGYFVFAGVFAILMTMFVRKAREI